MNAYSSNNYEILKNMFSKYLHSLGFFRYIQGSQLNQKFNVDEMITDHEKWYGSKIKMNITILYMVAEESTVVVLSEKTTEYLESYGGVPSGIVSRWLVYNTYIFKDGKIYTIDRMADSEKIDANDPKYQARRYLEKALSQTEL